MSLLEKLRTVLTDQWAMAQNFYANPQTRTPILIIWVASFGGALHASVTTFFYLEIGARDMDIGRIGFIQSLGLLILSPLAGYALDHGVPVFGPLLVTATCCSLGCLWRGIATNVANLYVAAGMLSIGANLWTVVLLQVSHCTPRDHRSHVLSGFSVQETGLRFLGKAMFPFWDFAVRAILRQVDDYNTTLFRYRIHMGICTFFCFFGTLALLLERSALQQAKPLKEGHQPAPIIAAHASSPNSHSQTISPSYLEVALASPEATSKFKPSLLHASHPPLYPTKSNFRYVAILSALLIQSWSSTVLAVLWPLVLRDQFQFAATEYGVVVVLASICSTSLIASFPTLEHHFGRIRTAASGATVACLACALAFVVLPNLMHRHNTMEDETNPDAVPLENSGFLNQQSLLVHVVLAIVFEAAVRMLEPSLKSILSLTVPVSAQNRSLGVMSTLGGLGGMGGNLMGTWLFGIRDVRWLGNGTLPFAAVVGVLAMASIFLWSLEWEESMHHHHHGHAITTEEVPIETLCEETGNREEGCGNAASQPAGASQNHNGDGQHPDRVFFPLMQMDTTYEMKLD